MLSSRLKRVFVDEKKDGNKENRHVSSLYSDRIQRRSVTKRRIEQKQKGVSKPRDETATIGV